MNSPEKGKAGRERAADAGGGAGAGGAATAEAGPGLSLDLARLRFDQRGLVAAIAQDAFTGRVLMLAWANRDAVERTLATGEAWFWSRSRAELWRKGDTSGNVLRVVEVAADCDGDALLLSVEPAGPACHTGATSCFDSGAAREAGGLDLGALERIVRSRAEADPAVSYTARLLAEGAPRIAQKVGEEATEVVVAALSSGAPPEESKQRLIEEVSDLLFHLAVLLHERGVSMKDVAEELASRHRQRRTGGTS
jgi:phosphoribosyl-ATP pyrophosphohydrolase/phosphoribosyl-AMP cyclohydrolase